MRVLINNETDIANLVTSLTLSGDTKTAARKLNLTFIQSDVDLNVPVVDLDCGYTIFFYDDDLIFQGNVYELEKDRAKSEVKIVAYDNGFVINRSKTSRKFTGALPEDITRSICSEMGIKIGNIAVTNTPVSFIAHSKTGYQVILSAYTEAHKVNQKIYQIVFVGDELNVIEKGTLIDNLVLDASINLTDSIYKKSILDLVNMVRIVDSEGNFTGEIIFDSESISKYSMFQETIKVQKDKDTQEEARAMLKKPALEGTVVALGDWRVKSGYSLIVRDSNFTGKFYIDSDTHELRGGQHTMRLKLAFENLMTEEKVEKEKK